MSGCSKNPTGKNPTVGKDASKRKEASHQKAGHFLEKVTSYDNRL